MSIKSCPKRFYPLKVKNFFPSLSVNEEKREAADVAAHRSSASLLSNSSHFVTAPLLAMATARQPSSHNGRFPSANGRKEVGEGNSVSNDSPMPPPCQVTPQKEAQEEDLNSTAIFPLAFPSLSLKLPFAISKRLRQSLLYVTSRHVKTGSLIGLSPLFLAHTPLPMTLHNEYYLITGNNT